MPIRTKNPPMTLSGRIQRPLSQPKRNVDLRWYVAQVKSRQERALADDLQQRGIEYFLPLHSTLVRGSNRRISGRTPLFPGYMFFYGDPFTPADVRKTKRVASIITIPWSAQPPVFAELRALHQALHLARKRRAKVDPFSGLIPETTAKILGGSLKGHIAPVLALDKKRTLVLLRVTVLGQTVAMEFPPDLLEPT